MVSPECMPWLLPPVVGPNSEPWRGFWFRLRPSGRPVRGGRITCYTEPTKSRTYVRTRHVYIPKFRHTHSLTELCGVRSCLPHTYAYGLMDTLRGAILQKTVVHSARDLLQKPVVHSARDRSTTHSLPIRVSTKSSISHNYCCLLLLFLFCTQVGVMWCGKSWLGSRAITPSTRKRTRKHLTPLPECMYLSESLSPLGQQSL